MIIVGQQYGISYGPERDDPKWFDSREAAASELKDIHDWTEIVGAHLVVRDIGPARNVDGTESPDFAAHADDALGLGL